MAVSGAFVFHKHILFYIIFLKEWIIHHLNVNFLEMIDCMGFNGVFNSISVIPQWPVHLSMTSWSSFNQYSTQYSLHWLLSHITIVETWDWTSDLLFSSFQCFRLSYGALQVSWKRHNFRLSYGARQISWKRHKPKYRKISENIKLWVTFYVVNQNFT